MTAVGAWAGLEKVREGWAVREYDPDGFVTDGKVLTPADLADDTIRIMVRWETEGEPFETTLELPKSSRSVRVFSREIVVSSTDCLWSLRPQSAEDQS